MLLKKTKRQKAKKKPCFFLEKLFKILESNSNKNLIHWSKEGISIIITDSYKFSNKILPIYFKHNSYSSFYRQLNLYGFHKIRNIKNSKIEQFINKNFTRDKTLEEVRKMKKNNLNYNNDYEYELNEEEIKEEIFLLDEFIKKIKRF